MLTSPSASATRPAAAPERPDLSVIVPSVNGGDILLECLDAVRANRAPGLAIEILVIDRSGDQTRRAVAQRFPEAIVLAVAPQTTIPEMRAIGFRSARADAVAVIEDHVLVPAAWAQQLLGALAAGSDVVGGSVHNAATATTVDWAAFLCEYSHMLAPVGGRRVDGLTGNNVVYRRSLIQKYSALLEEGRWEDHLHAALRRDGVSLTCRPDIAVGHKMHYRIRDYVSQRFLYARAFAGMRGSELTATRRALFALGTAVLPPVLFFRVVRRVLAARRHRAELLRSLPLLALFVCSWAAGEAIGYGIGAGDALSRVK